MSKNTGRIKLPSKFPNSQESLPVFSLILFIVFSFTTFRMLFQIPSWLNSHSTTDIFFLASYVFAVALIECLLLFGFILLINFILPGKFFRAHFVAQGSLVITICTIWALILKFITPGYEFANLQEPLGWLLIFMLSLLIILLAGSFLLRRYQQIEDLVDSLADRMVIFAWIYAPIGLISLCIVLIRNIF